MEKEKRKAMETGKTDRLLQEVRNKAEGWLSESYDADTRREVQALLDNEDPTELIECFYKDLEFGTGGLRGIMGVGSNRMNIYTVGAATQGLSNYLKKAFADLPKISVVIGYDCRNNSRRFAEISADIFSANGIHVYLFDDLRPTPEMSFAIRRLGCQSGIILTASHNPKEYNGYKAYWNDGAQMVPPHDDNTIAEVNRVRTADIRFQGNPALIHPLGKEMDEDYIRSLTQLSLSPVDLSLRKVLKIVFTPIHGTGVRLVPKALQAFGFTNIIHVPEQDVVSGDFPTVVSPNPEEPAALSLAVSRAQETNAAIVLATDPDGDRIGAAVKDNNGKWILLNGNQAALLFIYYIIHRRIELGLLKKNDYVVKTIVTTETIRRIAEHYGVELFDVYTGFKWIADVIRRNEGKKTYIGGGEESYGFLWEDFVRDKDAVSGAALYAEVAAWAHNQGLSLYRLLERIYVNYGYSKEVGISLVRKGKSGAEEIAALMSGYRNNPPVEIGGSPVTLIKDFASLQGRRPQENETFALDMPVTSDVLQYFTADGTKISIRPSGTEPKIKFYIELHVDIRFTAELPQADAIAQVRLDAVRRSLHLD
jgi:phosphoglucomutase